MELDSALRSKTGTSVNISKDLAASAFHHVINQVEIPDNLCIKPGEGGAEQPARPAVPKAGGAKRPAGSGAAGAARSKGRGPRLAFICELAFFSHVIDYNLTCHREYKCKIIYI